MTLRSRARYEPPSPDDFARTTLGLTVTREPADAESATLAVRPKLNGLNLAPLMRRAEDLIADGVRVLTIDLSSCGYVDTRAQGLLLAIANRLKRLAARGGQGRLTVLVTADMRAVFTQAQLDHLFEVR